MIAGKQTGKRTAVDLKLSRSSKIKGAGKIGGDGKMTNRRGPAGTGGLYC